MFNQLFITVNTYYKKSYPKKALSIAVFYISLFQISLLFLLGSFFAGFFKQMYIETLSADNAWLLFIVTSIAIYFKNWMTYSGRNLMILKAKVNNKNQTRYNIFLLWLLPFASTTLAIILLRSFL